MPNRLAAETSPYLLQHAHNPVDWYPWGEEALERARAEDRPVLLSIGYSACHWCHVMAHESFENQDTAHLMNEAFVNIKVDREERPDLDAIYLQAVEAIAGRGGWPLTIFLTPDGKPFYGGTYFPPEDRHGLPGFPRVLAAVAAAYRSRRQEIEQSSGQLAAALAAEAAAGPATGALTAASLQQAWPALQQAFDAVNGGFGQAPKFPQPLALDFLLRHHRRTADRDALHVVTFTLEKMCRGGIYDQIGGGFHRYATDSRWLAPHFEKMLYDNALLARLYLHAYLVTRQPLFRRIAEETIDYVLREMTAPEGGFYAAQDADVDGQEGSYYLWTPDEIRQALGEKSGDAVCDYYRVTAGGNFEGRSILHVPGDRPEAPDAIREAKSSLLQRRAERKPPGRDEKVLASWNGLMLACLAEAASVLDRRDYLAAAMANASFLARSLVSADGYLKRSSKDGRAGTEGYLEDYASLVEAFLELHRATFSGRWLAEAVRLAGLAADLFWDEGAGAFYDTGSRHQALYVRPRSVHDGALPSGTAAATLALLKVSRLTGNARLERIAQRSLGTMQELMGSHPLAFGHWLCTLDFHLSPHQEIVMAGPAGGEMSRVLYDAWLPNAVFAALDPEDLQPAAELELLRNKGMIEGRPAVYICQRYSCLAPATTPEELRRQLR